MAVHEDVTNEVPMVKHFIAGTDLQNILEPLT